MFRANNMMKIKVIHLVALLVHLGLSNAKPVEHVSHLNNVLRDMNLTADPCENFYEFACGKWKPEVVYTKREKYSQLRSLTNQVISTVKGFLENETVLLNDVYPDQLKPLRKYYKVCVKSNEKPMTKSSHYTDILKNIGGFPALEADWKEDSFDWIVMASNLNTFGCTNLLSEIIIPAYPFPFQFYKMNLGIGVTVTSETSNHTATKAYQLNSEEMLKILELYGVDEEKSQVIIKEILDFMKKVVKFNSLLSGSIESTADLLSNDTQNNTTDELFKSVLQKYMSIAWDIDSDEGGEITDIFDSQSDSDKLFLIEEFKEVNNTKKETVANYLSIKFLHYLHGDQELVRKDKKRFCSKQIMNANGYFVSLLYNSTISDKDQRARLNDLSQLMKEILKSLENRISNADWLDKETLEKAVLKINKIRTNVGQIDGESLGEIILDETMELEFSEVYEENRIKMLKFRNKLLHLPYKQKDFLSNTTTALELLDAAQVNAFYFVLDNSVYISNGILNLPVYSREQVAAVKYGRIGYILAHEVSHAFDSLGRLFDADGDEKNWWSSKSEKQYKDKSTCFKKDLDTILIKDLNDFMHGDLTSDEVIADLIGISIAYDSFQKNVENDGEYRVFKDHNLTKEQLFFVSFAQLYCVEYSQQQHLDEIEDEHPTDNVRAEAALRHLQIFSENFNCSIGSRMNPQKKCKMF